MDYNKKYKIATDLINKGYLIHCTDANFSSFEKSYIKGGSRAKEGYGFYFSDMPYKSIEYGNIFKIVKKEYFNFINALSSNFCIFENTFTKELYRLNKQLDDVRTNYEYDRISKDIEIMKTKYNQIGGRDFFDLIFKTIKKYNLKNIGSIENYIENPGINIPKLIEYYIYLGYDGYECDGIYTIFNIKKLNTYYQTLNIEKYMQDNLLESKKKKKFKHIIPYEDDNYCIGFEGNSSEGYCHVCEDIDVTSFDVQKELNPYLWKNEILDSKIRLKLLDIADDFTDFLNVDWVKPDDIILTGSLANYNWSENYSDIDLHIIIDFKKVDERVNFVKNYFDTKKKLWNETHKDISIYGFPVEVYVQDKNEKHFSSGVYSLEENKWLVKPKQMTSPKKSDLEKAETNANIWADKIDNLMKRYYPDKTDSQKEDIIKKLDKISNDIKQDRKRGFSKKNNELNVNNITFKMLRRNGYIDKIYDTKNKIYNNLMSID